jgi:hypothetical protein
VADRELARLFTPTIRLQVVEPPPGLALLNRFSEAWWRLVRVLL